MRITEYSLYFQLNEGVVGVMCISSQPGAQIFGEMFNNWKLSLGWRSIWIINVQTHEDRLYDTYEQIWKIQLKWQRVIPVVCSIQVCK